jgi:hypothetical protein
VVCLDVKDLTPEEKVKLAVEMSDLCVKICINSIRDQNEGISEEELMEKVRARISWNRRQPLRGVGE